MRRSYCSLQKNGTGEYGVGRLAVAASRERFVAASAPCSAAFVQCSTRISSSKSGLCQRATSPAAYTSGRPAFRSAPQTTPSSDLEPGTVEPRGRSASRRSRRRPRRPARPLRRRAAPRRCRARRPDAAADVDAMVGVHGRDGGTHLRAEAPHQRGGAAFEHEDVVAESAGRGSDLEADEAGADDDDASPAASRAQHAVAARRRGCAARGRAACSLLAGEPARRRARRDDQSVERARRYRRDNETVRPSRSRPIAAAPVRHVTSSEPMSVGLAERDPVGFPVAAEQSLRQWRPVVRVVRFVADHVSGPSKPPCGASRPRGGRRAMHPRRRHVPSGSIRTTSDPYGVGRGRSRPGHRRRADQRRWSRRLPGHRATTASRSATTARSRRTT